MFEAVQLSSGRILAASENGFWTMSPEGKDRSVFNAELNNAFVPSPCGRFVVFLSSRSGRTLLMRSDSDGANLTTLVDGNPVFPVCSKDGKYLYYVNFDQPQHVWRVSVEGGTPVKVAKTLGDSLIGRLSVSPDGRLLAYPYTEYTNKPEPGWHLVVISATGASSEQIFKVPSNIDGPRWSFDGKSLQYLLTQNGATNIWEQPLTGGQPRQITHFHSGHIFDFSWTIDGRHLLLTRGDISSDVVLLRGFQ
jgi:Tol biopolymer transport system component